MARTPSRNPKKRAGKKQPAAIKLRVKRHIERLGFNNVHNYLAWCRDEGFASSVDKSTADLEAELARYEREQERRKAIERIDRNPRELIEKACAGTLEVHRITRPNWQLFAHRIMNLVPGRMPPDLACKVLLAVQERSDFLFENASFGDETPPYVIAVLRLVSWHKHWVRPIETWESEGHGHRKHFSSLARHLLAQYPLAAFMDSVWFREDERGYQLRNLYVKLGKGQKLSPEADLGLPMTRQMKHLYFQAPPDYSVEHAVRWAEILGLGGNRRLVEAVLPTRLGQDLTHASFWRTVFSFFIRNPMLDVRHVGPIIDFIYFQKFDPQDILVGPGEVRVEQPPQPGFTMRGRSPEALLRQVDAWHQELGRRRAASGVFFQKVGFPGFQQKCSRKKGRVWTVRQLLSASELVEEGRAMSHCVATYTRSCERGDCSIWSLLSTTHGVTKRHLTIEVTRHGQIVQVRGLANRLPTSEEFSKVQEWARNSRLWISPYLNHDE